jgi:uncharacterized protein (DUF305 family)
MEYAMKNAILLIAAVLGFLMLPLMNARAAETGSTAAYMKAMDTMMQNMKVTYIGDADIDFVKSMIPHHQGAIDMASVELEFGKDPEILKLAGDIAKAQHTEIAIMKEWLAENATTAGAPDPASTRAYETAMSTMMANMMVSYTGDADADLMKGMIPHHQGAIDMAKVVLDHGKDREIQALAQSIITAQEGEIAVMRTWLEKHSG